MNETEKLAFLSSVISILRRAQSWTGRMHIQKFVYFVRELLGHPVEYEFVLYHRGPYSFELADDVRLLRSVGAADIIIRPAPYGPSYVTTTRGDALAERSGPNEHVKGRLERLAQLVGPKDAAGLELLATTLWATKEQPASEDEEIVSRIRELKPQFSPEQVRQAIDEMRDWQKRFSE